MAKRRTAKRKTSKGGKKRAPARKRKGLKAARAYD